MGIWGIGLRVMAYAKPSAIKYFYWLQRSGFEKWKLGENIRDYGPLSSLNVN